MASKKPDEDIGPPESFRRFQRLMGRLLTVSKAESDKQMAEARERNRQIRDKKKGPQ